MVPPLQCLWSCREANRLTGIRDEAGEVMTFTYGPNGVDYEARWKAFGVKVVLEGTATIPPILALDDALSPLDPQASNYTFRNVVVLVRIVYEGLEVPLSYSVTALARPEFATAEGVFTGGFHNASGTEEVGHFGRNLKLIWEGQPTPHPVPAPSMATPQLTALRLGDQGLVLISLPGSATASAPATEAVIQQQGRRKYRGGLKGGCPESGDGSSSIASIPGNITYFPRLHEVIFGGPSLGAGESGGSGRSRGGGIGPGGESFGPGEYARWKQAMHDNPSASGSFTFDNGAFVPTVGAGGASIGQALNAQVVALQAARMNSLMAQHQQHFQQQARTHQQRFQQQHAAQQAHYRRQALAQANQPSQGKPGPGMPSVKANVWTRGKEMALTATGVNNDGHYVISPCVPGDAFVGEADVLTQGLRGRKCEAEVFMLFRHGP